MQNNTPSSRGMDALQQVRIDHGGWFYIMEKLRKHMYFIEVVKQLVQRKDRHHSEPSVNWSGADSKSMVPVDDNTLQKQKRSVEPKLLSTPRGQYQECEFQSGMLMVDEGCFVSSDGASNSSSSTISDLLMLLVDDNTLQKQKSQYQESHCQTGMSMVDEGCFVSSDGASDSSSSWTRNSSSSDEASNRSSRWAYYSSSSSFISERQRNTLSKYSVGDTVKVIGDKNREKEVLKCHGGRNKFMNLISMEKGIVKFIYPNGDLLENQKNLKLKVKDEIIKQSKDFPLHMAVWSDDYQLCCKLVEKGADVNCLNGKCMSPIMLAAKIGCEKVLSLLVQHPDARLDIEDQESNTALHLATKHSNVNAVRILLDAGADIKAVNNEQFTPFHLAAMNGHEKILELFLFKYGESLVDLQKDDKFAAIHLATLNHRTACLRLLIEHNADLNIRNNKMQTALHIAVSQKYMDCVKILMDSEAEVDLQDEDGNTPLYNAIDLDNIHKMKKMIARFKLQNMFKFSGSMPRSSDKAKDIAIYLVEHGARLDTLNNDGNSPLTLCQDESLQKRLRKIQAKRCRVQEIPSQAEPDSQKEPLAIQNLQNEILCLICQENRANVAFNCGHRACSNCANNLNDCHLCR